MADFWLPQIRGAIFLWHACGVSVLWKNMCWHLEILAHWNWNYFENVNQMKSCLDKTGPLENARNDTANSNEVKYKEKQNTLIFKSYSTYIELNTLQRQDV